MTREFSRKKKNKQRKRNFIFPNQESVDMVNMEQDEDEIDNYSHIHLHTMMKPIGDKLNYLLLNLLKEMVVE